MPVTKLSDLNFSFKTNLKQIENPIKIQIQINEKATSKTSPSRVFKGFDNYDDLSTFVRNNSDLSIHEVTRCGTDSHQRIFFDIDANYKDFPNKDQLLKAYNILLKSIKYELANANVYSTEYYELISHTEEKFSSHIVYKHAYINALHYDCFYEKVIENFIFDLDLNCLPNNLVNIIDKNVYGLNHCLRVHTSHKFGKTTKLALKTGSNKQFNPQTLVQYVYSATELNRNSVKTYVCYEHAAKKTVTKSEITNDLMRTASAIIETLQKYGISERKINGNFINLNIDHSKPCYVCGGVHENENMMAVVSPQNVKLICRRQAVNSPKRYKIIHEFTKYVECIQLPIAAASNILTKSDYLPSIDATIIKFTELYLRSDLGSGKSTKIYEYIAKQLAANPDFICIFLTYRIVLAAKIFKDTNSQINDDGIIKFSKYNDIAGYTISIQNNKLLIVQLESLARLDYDLDKTQTPDLLIIDEAVSFAQQNLSGLNESKIGINMSMLENLMKTSKQIIISDALLDNATINAYEKLRPSTDKVVWINEPMTNWAPIVTIYEDFGYFRRTAIEDVRAGKKIYISVTRGEKWIKQLERYLLRKAPNKHILTIYGGKPDNERIIENINTELIQYDIVIASPCMSAGVSFDVRGYFDKIYAYIESKGPTAVDVIQSLKRVRHTKTNEIIICNMTNNINLPTTIQDIFEYEERNLKFNSMEYINNGFSTKMLGSSVCFRHPEDTLLQWIFHCKQIVNLNKIHLFETVMNYLLSKGAIVNMAKDEQEYEDEIYSPETDNRYFRDEVKAVKHEENLNIALAPVLNYDEYESLTKDRKRISAENRPAIDKYKLLRHYGFEHNLSPGLERNKRIRSFNNPDFIKLYSSESVKSCYNSVVYRDLSYDTIARLDYENTHYLSEQDKTRYNYLLGRHVTINKIISAIPVSGIACGDMVLLLKELQNTGNPLLVGKTIEINNKLQQIINNIIGAYCYKVTNRKLGPKNKRILFLYLEDVALALFDIKYVKLTEGDFGISLIKQSGESPMPTVCIYKENEKTI